MERGRLGCPLRENLIADGSAEAARETARTEAPLAGTRGQPGFRSNQGAPLTGDRAERVHELLRGDPAYGRASENIFAFVLRIAVEGGRLVGA